MPGFGSERVGLNGLPCTRHETINDHGLPGHHVFAEKGIGGRQIGYVNCKMLSFLYGGLEFSRVLGVSGSLNKSFFLDSLIS